MIKINIHTGKLEIDETTMKRIVSKVAGLTRLQEMPVSVDQAQDQWDQSLRTVQTKTLGISREQGWHDFILSLSSEGDVRTQDISPLLFGIHCYKRALQAAAQKNYNLVRDLLMAAQANIRKVIDENLSASLLDMLSQHKDFRTLSREQWMDLSKESRDFLISSDEKVTIVADDGKYIREISTQDRINFATFYGSLMTAAMGQASGEEETKLLEAIAAWQSGQTPKQYRLEVVERARDLGARREAGQEMSTVVVMKETGARLPVDERYHRLNSMYATRVQEVNRGNITLQDQLAKTVRSIQSLTSSFKLDEEMLFELQGLRTQVADKVEGWNVHCKNFESLRGQYLDLENEGKRLHDELSIKQDQFEAVKLQTQETTELQKARKELASREQELSQTKSKKEKKRVNVVLLEQQCNYWKDQVAKLEQQGSKEATQIDQEISGLELAIQNLPSRRKDLVDEMEVVSKAILADGYRIEGDVERAGEIADGCLQSAARQLGTKLSQLSTQIQTLGANIADISVILSQTTDVEIQMSLSAKLELYRQVLTEQKTISDRIQKEQSGAQAEKAAQLYQEAEQALNAMKNPVKAVSELYRNLQTYSEALNRYQAALEAVEALRTEPADTVIKKVEDTHGAVMADIDAAKQKAVQEYNRKRPWLKLPRNAKDLEKAQPEQPGRFGRWLQKRAQAKRDAGRQPGWVLRSLENRFYNRIGDRNKAIEMVQKASQFKEVWQQVYAKALDRIQRDEIVTVVDGGLDVIQWSILGILGKYATGKPIGQNQYDSMKQAIKDSKAEQERRERAKAGAEQEKQAAAQVLTEKRQVLLSSPTKQGDQKPVDQEPIVPHIPMIRVQ